MEASDFLLSVIKASGGAVRGRTLLQKRCYFVSVLLRLENEFGFQAHYYGPYSPSLDSALSQIVAAGLVEESSIAFGAADSSGFEIRRHDYRITSDGQEVVEFLAMEESIPFDEIERIVTHLRDSGEPNYYELSIAAKAFFILKNQKRAMTVSEIRSEAESFGWSIEAGALTRAIEFLRKAELTQPKKSSNDS